MGEKMKNNKAWIFGVLAGVLAVAALVICLTQRDAPPKLFGKAEGAEACARSMMEHISRGDYAGASAYLYGSPTLGTDAQRETPAAQLIWNAFVSSLECRSRGGCYATDTGVAMDFTVSGLDIPSLTRELKQRASAVLEARVEAAEDMSQVYDSNQQYREEFAKSVLEEAAREAVAASSSVERTVSVQLVYEGNQWWVLPDQALMIAISGGIL